MNDHPKPFYKMAGLNYFKQMAHCEYVANKLFIQLCKELERHPVEWLLWTEQGGNLSTAYELEVYPKLQSLPNSVQCVVYTVPGKSEHFYFRSNLFTSSLETKLLPLPSAHWLARELQQFCQARSTCNYLSSNNQTFSKIPLSPSKKLTPHDSIFPIIQRTRQSIDSHSQGHQEEIGSPVPLVSILLSVHNMESTIGWSIRSVLAQNSTNFELLIGDDGSTDNTVQQVSLMNGDNRIRLFRYSMNRGKAFVLNDLLREASGKYVLELDADDWLPSHALRTLISLMEQHPTAALGTGTSLVWRKSRDGHFSLRGQASFEGTLETDTHACPPVPRIYLTQHLREVGGWTEYAGIYGKIFEDIEVCRKLLKKYKFIKTEEMVYHRVIHTRSVSQQYLHQYEAWKQNRILHERGGEST
ncbi:glycosyltransferase family A protein [Paenibacillus sp. Marseille-Q4541]|uniref:glycosyltransferase family 2 protein n=1 Tax=Paenibacillus sp. Marseille-Q4541 TaxID=2831522 RepID=UPI001BABF0EF|nr:glycosyltransferase family A protein [Paenibacillus sp. Marseille-Q4541]